MLLLVLVAVGLVAALAIGVTMRHRLRWLVLAGLVAFAGWSLFSSSRACPPGHECTPLLGVLLGAFVLAGWLVGIVVAAWTRGLARRRGAVR